MAKKIVKKNLVDQVTEFLQEAIESGEYQVGDRLPSENDLANEFGTSRLTVRLAIQKLNALELLETKVGDGTYVKRFSFEKYVDNVSDIIFSEDMMGDIREFRDCIEKRFSLITRVDEEKSRETERLLAELYPTGSGYQYFKEAKVAICGSFPEKDGVGTIVVATGGTSDIPVAEEAALTAEALGNQVERLYDVGVAGLHRLISHMDSIMNARVIIAIAGMEGALASVIGGLADCPVIAVPTSIGYGASFGGVSALLSMLNSCASGVSVVNIDNGFGAGYLASMMNHMRG